MNNGQPPLHHDSQAVREVALLPDEKVAHCFTPDKGLTGQIPVKGEMLVVTSERLIAFRQGEGSSRTFLAPVGELNGVAVKSGSLTLGSILQGALLAVGSVFIYIVVAYWIQARVEGPEVPVINMAFGPFIMFLGLLMGLALIAKFYFAKPDGSVTFQGRDWTLEFPYRSDRAGEEIQQVVSSVFAARQSRNGHEYLWDD